MTANASQNWSITKRQLLVASVIFVLLFTVVSIIYIRDLDREWRLRTEQSAHRLQLAYELIVRDFQRVKSDLLFLADQPEFKNFDSRSKNTRQNCENRFEDFLRAKRAYQQIRLIDGNGLEVVRADLVSDKIRIVPEHELQNKQDRYYVQESKKLDVGELFVSEFDLNLEHGEIEQPLNPVVRFVTKVSNSKVSPRSVEQGYLLLVVNYKGAPLLNELSMISLPGSTYLVREDGHFLLAPESREEWGWLLNHDHNFASKFPNAWSRRAYESCQLTRNGAFSFRRLGTSDGENLQKELYIVSHQPRNKVFATSNELFLKLCLVLAAATLPILMLTRYWASSTHRRQVQAEFIRESEMKLRQLSTRLVQIQEDERRAISREIHDQLGQQATAINLDLKLALRETTEPKAQEHLERTIKETEQLLEGLHDFATRVRPTELDDLGLVEAIESHVWEFSDRSGVKTTLDLSIDEGNLDRDVKENVFRLIQESLNNVLKHANATRVGIQVFANNNQQSEPTELFVIVHDDGVGLQQSLSGHTTTDERKSLGLVGMQERVELLNGTIKIDSTSRAGTKIDVRIPIQQAE